MSTPPVDNDYKYPIVPTFGDWRFPHDRFAAGMDLAAYQPSSDGDETLFPNESPGRDSKQPSNSIKVGEVVQNNEMWRYGPDPERRNLMIGVMNKPSAGSPLVRARRHQHSTEPRPHAFAVHRLSQKA
ncbi:hypothetical protein FHL15_007785 [Xylaria flabelliformis]|uniref:Uncharacterized protein n=1 Tax=Xylaria flabelliformis TaxID=2512241 RepID=A0A553HTT7_9PEZI|nr:hypothetical protein FHL15_007785 [Xylaria flabelliformis]